MDKEKTLQKLKQEIQEVRKKCEFDPLELVGVVRCRDCIGKDTLYTADGGILICGMSGLSPVEDRDFCSHGERRKQDA